MKSVRIFEVRINIIIIIIIMKCYSITLETKTTQAQEGTNQAIVRSSAIVMEHIRTANKAQITRHRPVPDTNIQQTLQMSLEELALLSGERKLAIH